MYFVKYLSLFEGADTKTKLTQLSPVVMTVRQRLLTARSQRPYHTEYRLYARRICLFLSAFLWPTKLLEQITISITASGAMM